MIKPLKAIIVKETKLLFRDPAGLIMLFVLPSIFIFVLSIALQGTFSSASVKEKMDVVLVNSGDRSFGDEIGRGLESSGYFRVVTGDESGEFTLESAKAKLSEGKYKIIVVIPADAREAIDFKVKSAIDVIVDPVLSNEFSANITSAIQNFVYLSIIKNLGEISRNILNKVAEKRVEELTKQVAETEKKRSQLRAQLAESMASPMDDKTKKIIEKLTLDSINELTAKINEFKAQVDEYSGNKDEAVSEIKDSGVKVNEIGLTVNQLYYSKTGDEIFPNSVQQNVPGWTIFALFWIVQIIAINLIAERQSGSYKRIRVSPINMATFICGKIIPFFFINLLQAVVMFAIGVYVLPIFGCPRLEIVNIVAIIILTLAISFVAISFGLFVSAISKTVVLAASMSASVLIIMTVIGGIMVPRFVMPSFMQKMSYYVPHGWGLDGYINILVKKYGVADIVPNLAVLLGFGIVFFGISLLTFNKGEKE